MSRIYIAKSHLMSRCFSRIVFVGIAVLAFVSASFGQINFVEVHGKLKVNGNQGRRI